MAVSQMQFLFFAVLLLAMTFTSGYFLGKSQQTPQVVTQQQPSQQGQQQAKPQVAMEDIKKLFSKDLIKFGKGDKKLVFVEVSDPSCPFCHVAGGQNKAIGSQMGPQFVLASEGGTYVAPMEEMKKLVKNGKADMVWLYTNGHGNGEMGTKALYCAYEQGKFFEAHDLLMTEKGYELLNTEVKNDTAKSQVVADFFGGVLNKGKLKSCLDSGKYNDRLKTDSSEAQKLGVNGTPGFFINNTNFAGAYSWSDMKATVDAVL